MQTQPYVMTGHSHSHDDLGGSSSKRQRIANPYSTATSPYGHLPYSAPQHHVPSFAEGGVTGHYVPRQPQGSAPTTPYSGTPAAPQGQWTQSYTTNQAQGLSSHYQDPRSMQHPYFYGQTDPSVYNSPWPPQQHETQHVSAAPLVPTQQLQPLSYLPQASTSVPAEQSYSSPAYAPTLSTFDVGSFGIGHNVASQQQQSRRSPSNMYFEDASMHLKMQSLPILDSLVGSVLHFFTDSR